MLTSSMKYGFFISSIADLLSTIIVTFSSFECVSLLSSLFNHNACVAAVVAAMNLDSHDDSATVACFLCTPANWHLCPFNMFLFLHRTVFDDVSPLSALAPSSSPDLAIKLAYSWKSFLLVDIQGETFRIRKFVCKRFDMIPECVSAWGNQIHSTPTPWSTVRFYLESALQTGTLQEIIGNADEAKTKYLPGKSITSLLNLPMFIAAFSIRIEDDCSSIGCEKCRIIWKVTLDMEFGDHCLGAYKTNEAYVHYLPAAIEQYLAATKSLELNIWRDNDARPG
nr:hypothetical protein [Tanacetum cinerariifolium]